MVTFPYFLILGTKNVATSSELTERFCTEIDLKGECGYSMNRAQTVDTKNTQNTQ